MAATWLATRDRLLFNEEAKSRLQKAILLPLDNRNMWSSLSLPQREKGVIVCRKNSSTVCDNHIILYEKQTLIETKQ